MPVSNKNDLGARKKKKKQLRRTSFLQPQRLLIQSALVRIWKTCLLELMVVIVLEVLLWVLWLQKLIVQNRLWQWMRWTIAFSCIKNHRQCSQSSVTENQLSLNKSIYGGSRLIHQQQVIATMAHKWLLWMSQDKVTFTSTRDERTNMSWKLNLK